MKYSNNFILMSLCVALTLILTTGQKLAAQSVPSYVPKDGLIGWWPFNGNASDESGNGNNGVARGTVSTTDRCGAPNSAYRFDSAARVVTTIPNAPKGSEPRTVACWVYSERYEVPDRHIAGFPFWFAPGRAYSLSVLRASVSDLSLWGFDYDFAAGAELKNGQWHFVAATYNGSQLNMYVDGRQYRRDGVQFNTIETDFVIGSFDARDGQMFSLDGKIDDVGLWNRALTEQEIKNLYYYQCCGVAIAKHPTSDTLLRCKQAVLSVVATADTTLFYRWQRNDGAGFTDLSNGSSYSGVSTANLTVLAMSSQTKGAYRCIVSTSKCSDTSKVATLDLKNSLPGYLPQSGLIGWWPFNCDADDESGNGLDGIVHGAILTSDRSSTANTSYSFDGINDYINIGHHAVLDFATHSNMTFAFWVKADNMNNPGAVISKYQQGSSTNSSYLFMYGAQSIRVYGTGDPNKPLLTVNETTPESWTHIVAVLNHLSDSATLYRDGILLLKGAVDFNPNATTVAVMFGMADDGPAGSENSLHFKGAIDDVGIWNRALTQQEIGNLYKGQGCNITITTHPSSDTVTRCQQSRLTVVAKADTTVTYQWQRQAGASWVNLSNGALYNGATTSTLTVLSMSGQTEGAYRCAIKTSSCSDTSRIARLTIRTSVPGYVPRSGLVGWWPFDCNADDESGNGNNGTIIDTITSVADRSGKASSAYRFNGQNGKISVVMSLPTGSKPRTIASWFRTSSTFITTNSYPNLQTIAAYGTGRGGKVIYNQYVIAPKGSAYFESGSSGDELFSKDPVNDGKWHHMVTTYGGANTRVKLYVDGVLHDSTAPLILETDSSEFGIGYCPWSTIHFRGDLDDIGLWNRALSEAEVKRLYGDECTGGQRQYPLDSMKLTGSAKYEASAVTLTPSATFSAGSAWLPKKHVVRRGFDVRFRFRMQDGTDNALVDGGPQGADGIAFVLQNTSSVVTGAAGDGIGYNGVPSGLVVEFDTYQNPAFSDPSPNHIAVQVGDGQVIRPWHVAPFLRGITSTGVPAFTADGRVYHARITLQGQRLSVYCDTTGSLSVPLLTVDSIDIAQILKLDADGATYLGFTSATGFSQQQHELLDLSIEECDPLVSVNDETTEPTTSLTGRIIPVPARNEARLEFSGPLPATGVFRIYDVRGMEVATGTIPAGNQSWSLPVAGLTTGSYRVQLQTSEAVISVPLLLVP